jgi:hypothetical protein
MNIDLTARELPTKGLQPGAFADVVQEEKYDQRRKKHIKVLTLIGELAATKSNGQRFNALATWNLDDDRGVKRLIEDLNTWQGTNALPDLSQFDPEAEFLGKPFVSEITATTEGGKKVARLKGFRPDPEKRVTVSAGFVRAKDRPQAAMTAHTAPQGAVLPPAQAPAAA